jgi:hypothetical protein
MCVVISVAGTIGRSVIESVPTSESLDLNTAMWSL